VQVSWLGYLGTLGAHWYDYVLTDRFVAPPSQQAFFTERLLYLPDCYCPSDTRRPVASLEADRAACGLPADGVVFCCFNNSYKILPPVFDIWMRLLAAVPGSVLWLLELSASASAALRAAARSGGIDPARLVFAPSLRFPDHLARQPLADLCLDTLPYGGHTTASDALWSGVPLVTCRGTAFPGRVGASLLTALGLPELITESLADYEALALALAREPARLADLRARLAAQRTAAPLFDCRRFARDLERAYLAMMARHEAGQPPAPIRLEAA
jgi:predicted O-linked N-acetylglucosamine transferase (SPINDLY family)